MVGAGSARRRRTWLATAGAVLGAGGAAAVLFAATAQQPSPPTVDRDTLAGPTAPLATAPVTNRTPSSSPGSTVPTPRKSAPVLELPPSDPKAISIPRLNAASQLEQLELDASGAMQVPRDPDKAGWFTPSPSPGVTGSSVIAGHVTWNRRPAVFFRLAELRAGDQIRITREDGITAVFSVDRIGRFPKNQFPTDQVYGAADHAGLRLITCGGDYDASSNRYLDNIIVWAHLTGTIPGELGSRTRAWTRPDETSPIVGSQGTGVPRLRACGV